MRRSMRFRNSRGWKASFPRLSRPRRRRGHPTRAKQPKDHLMVTESLRRSDEDLPHVADVSKKSMTTHIDTRFTALKRKAGSTSSPSSWPAIQVPATWLDVVEAFPKAGTTSSRSPCPSRSDGGWSGDPGGGAARAEGRYDPEEDAGHGARLPQDDNATPLVLMDYSRSTCMASNFWSMQNPQAWTA